MNKTHDFKLNMPDYSDAVDIDILNDNFRVIDDALMAGLCEKEYTGNNMGSSDPASRKYAWAPWFEIKNENDFDVQVTDRNFETTITIEAGGTYRKYIVGTYYMNFYVQDQHDVTFRWFTDAETRINEIDPSGGGSVSSVNVTGASNSHIVTSGGPITSSGTIEIDLAEGYSIPQTNKQTSWDGKAADLKAEIDSSTYVLTLQLKDSSGNLIGNERTIDLPLETMVVDGEYDPQTQKIKLELKNGNYVEFSVADLVSGLQSELNSNNKLNPAYIAYDASHRAVSDTEKDTWNGKQNAISDLATIRSGAAAGATAVQPSEMQTALDDKQDTIDSTHKLSSALVSFSTAQNAALSSGVDSTKVDQISTNQANILYNLNMGVKNILKNTGNNTINNSVTYTVNSDGSVVSSGTASGGNGNFVVNNLTAEESYALNGMILSGCPSGGSSTTYRIVIQRNSSPWTSYVQDVGNGVKITGIPSGIACSVIISVVNGNQKNATWYPMICTEEAWNQSHDWQPHALTNSDLTRLEAEDRAALAKEIDAGDKNKLNWASATYLGDSNCTYSKTDTSLIASAGSSAAESRVFYSVGTFAAGNYVFKFKISSATISQQAIIYISTSTQASTSIASIQITANGEYELPFSWSGGTVYLKFYPNTTNTSSSNTFTVSDMMICTKAAFAVSQKVVPYRPSWDVIADSIKTVQIATSDFITVNTNFTILSQSTLFKHGSQVFGTLVIQKTDTAKFVDSLAAVGTIKSGYRPVVNLIGQSYYNTEQWGINGFGYSYINTSGIVSVKSSTDSANKYSYVAIPINYMTA